MLIKNVTIENFKRFEHLEVELESFDCIIGPNNSGKTTLLQALALFDFCIHNCLSSKNGVISLKRRSIALEDFYVLPVSSPAHLWTDLRVQAQNKHKLIKIIVAFDQGLQVTAVVDFSFNRLSVSIECEDQSQEWLQKLRQVRISYLPVFSMFLPQEERRTPVVIEDALARGRVNSVIRNLLLNLKYEERQGKLVEIMQRVFPDLTKMDIEFDEINDRYISVTYKEQGRSREFGIFSAGSGFQQFIYLFGFILLRQPTVILLDEPDVHLHGSLQRALLDELRQLVALGKQVLFATHSRDLIMQMQPENILTLEAESASRLAVAFDVYDALDSLGSVDPTQLPIIQAYRRVLVVENRADWDILAAFCTKILGSAIWQQVERRLAVCYARGNPCKQDMPRLRAQLQQVITLEGRALEMFVLADRDYHPDLEYLRQSLPSDKLHWHVWERTEIENYMLSIEGILRVLEKPRQLWPIGEAALREEFQNLLESSRDSANDRLVKAFLEYGRSCDKRWDAATLSRQAREYLQQHWETDKLALADAKEIVLPGIKRWLQSQRLGQFSDKALAAVMLPEDIPQEVHELAHRLAEFAGVTVP